MRALYSFNHGFPRSRFCMEAVLLGVLLLVGCGSPSSNDQSRAVRPPSQKPSAVSSDMGTGDLYAVVVGVSTYSHPKIPKLKFADKDAQAFAAFLDSQKKLFRKVQIRSLVNQQATRAEVEKCLVDLSLAGENDTVIVYISGHGSDDYRSPGQFFFLPYDADPDYLGPSSVNMSRQEYLQKLPSKRVLLVADTCHSGLPSQMTRAVEPAFERFMRQIKDTRGRVVLSASGPDEVSLEKAEMEHGVFTYYLLEGLRGAADTNRDGVVALHELYSYVQEKTKDNTRGAQHPRIMGDLGGTFPLSLVRLEPSATATVQPSTPAAVPPQLSELDLLRSRAERGDAKAQFELGLKYEYGLGVSTDKAEALKWYFKASEQGNGDAKVAIARLAPTSTAPSVSTPTPLKPAAPATPLTLTAPASSNRDHGKDEAFLEASGSGNLNELKRLLSDGADINAKDQRFELTALHRAARAGYTAIVQFLLDRGASVNAKDCTGETALHRAAWYGKTTIVELLLDRGADINATDKDGFTALHRAADRRNTAWRLLLNRGADVNAKNKDGKTARQVWHQ